MEHDGSVSLSWLRPGFWHSLENSRLSDWGMGMRWGQLADLRHRRSSLCQLPVKEISMHITLRNIELAVPLGVHP